MMTASRHVLPVGTDSRTMYGSDHASRPSPIIDHYVPRRSCATSWYPPPWVKGFLSIGVAVLSLATVHRVLAATSLPQDADARLVAELHRGKTVLDAHIFVYEDAGGACGLEDVRDEANHQFRRLAAGGETFGHSRSVYWLRFRVRNASETSSFVVDVGTPPTIVELYDDIGRARRSGMSFPFGERDVAYTNVAFRVSLAPGEARTFWIRQHTNDTVRLNPVMWSETEFWESRSSEHLLDGLCYGVILGLSVYNLFLFLGTRDRSYLLYVVFQMTNGLTQAALNAYTFQYLWPDHPAWAARSVAVLEFLCASAALAFGRAFLDVRRLSPRLDVALRVLWLCGLVLAAIWVVADQDMLRSVGGSRFLSTLYMVLLLLGRLHILVSIVLVTLAGVVAAVRTGATNARVFLIAWAVLLVGGLVSVLAVAGVLVSLAGLSLMKLGSAVEAVLLSLALASRINELRRDRERAQRELLAAKTARIEALRQLVSGVAHEVGNPLNFACGGSDELARQLEAIDRAAPGAGGTARRAHGLVASGLARIKLILDNLRRYLSVGDAEAVPTDVGQEIGHALELAAERLARAGVHVERDIAALPVLHVRPGQLHQVMLNLIANAIDAMPGGGALRIAARADEREVEVAVTDTGSGIDPADRENVFEPFFTTRRSAGGTGLGLAVAREIVMRHGGSIRVEASEQGGARFIVSLPCVQEAGRG